MSDGEKLLIKGLDGKRLLKGVLRTPGAKNAVLKVMAASLLFKDEVILENVPAIEDVHRMLELLADLGVAIEKKGEGNYRLVTENANRSDLSPEISKRMRSSVALTGALLGRFGRVSLPHPGGCVIGKRPIDLFIEGFTKLGAFTEDKEAGYVITASGGLKGAEIFFKNQSVGATETIMMAAVLADGTTVLKNCAMEPEIVSLGEFLNACGAKITGLGTPTIKITGTGLLSGKGKVYETMPDRIVAGSFVILGVLAGEDIEVTDCDPEHIDALLNALRLAGAKFDVGKRSIKINGPQGPFKAVDIKTHEYPGFPTDLQAPFSVLLTQAEGQSFLFETIFEGRLQYLETLARMGADAKILDAHRAIITGPRPLFGKEVESPDLRAGLAYVLAAIIATGTSTVHNVYYIDRGYEALEEALSGIGVEISRIA